MFALFVLTDNGNPERRFDEQVFDDVRKAFDFEEEYWYTENEAGREPFMLGVFEIDTNGKPTKDMEEIPCSQYAELLKVTA